MTKKDYIQFADMFKGYQPQGVYTCPECLELAKKTADIFQRDNPRFDRERFLLACGFRKEDM